MNEWTACECPTVGIVRQQSDGSVQSDQHQTQTDQSSAPGSVQ